MKIVSYNVNGLRPRLLFPQRTLAAFLDSLDADIICLQETKVARHDLTAHIAVAEGYESFFSCNRRIKHGRVGYSGVATFCRVGQLQSSTSPILPLAADEGFTGLLHRLETGEVEGGRGRVGCYEEVAKTDLSMQDLLELDSEGRCLITDHGSFVLFNLYCPRVESGDMERLEFKMNFFQTLQRRWDALLKHNRRIIAVGDFNISPYPIDSCHAGPQFDKNICRMWFRTQLRNEGGPFWDVFRYFHQDRKEAYTCWSQASGAEEFNFGTRIDLVLAAGSCNHGMVPESSCHGFVECEVQDCDILSRFRRAKLDSHPRWQGGRSLKLEGSDHAPIFVHLKEQFPIERHEVPPLAARFMPEIRGRQLNLVTLLKRHPSPGSSVVESKSKILRSPAKPASRQRDLRAFFSSSTSQARLTPYREEVTQCSSITLSLDNADTESLQTSCENAGVIDCTVSWHDSNCLSKEPQQTDRYPTPISESSQVGIEILIGSQDVCPSPSRIELPSEVLEDMDAEQLIVQLEQTRDPAGPKTIDTASAWTRIKEKMARAVPLCKGHDEPCVARVVKKAGPNVGRGFYVCARAEGPSSNPESRCNHFEWASSFKKRGKLVVQNRLGPLQKLDKQAWYNIQYWNVKPAFLAELVPASKHAKAVESTQTWNLRSV